jgi:hypothetical protein
VRVTKCEKILPSGAGADLGRCFGLGGVDRPRFVSVPRILLEGAPGAHVCPPVPTVYVLPVRLAGQVCFDPPRQDALYSKRRSTGCCGLSRSSRRQRQRQRVSARRLEEWPQRGCSVTDSRCGEATLGSQAGMFSIKPEPRLEHLVTNGRWQIPQRATLAVVDSATTVPAALLMAATAAATAAAATAAATAAAGARFCLRHLDRCSISRSRTRSSMQPHVQQALMRPVLSVVVVSSPLPRAAVQRISSISIRHRHGSQAGSGMRSGNFASLTRCGQAYCLIKSRSANEDPASQTPALPPNARLNQSMQSTKPAPEPLFPPKTCFVVCSVIDGTCLMSAFVISIAGHREAVITFGSRHLPNPAANMSCCILPGPKPGYLHITSHGRLLRPSVPRTSTQGTNSVDIYCRMLVVHPYTPLLIFRCSTCSLPRPYLHPET